MGETRVTGTGPAEMKALAARLREADPALKRALRRNMRDIAAPTVARVQASILSMPSHHAGQFRAHIAATVTSSVGITRNGVQISILSRGAKMGPGQGEDTLPKHVDSRRGWAHPVFARRGRERVWVRQMGKPGWFEDPIGRSGPAVQRACQQAMDEVKRKLEH